MKTFNLAIFLSRSTLLLVVDFGSAAFTTTTKPLLSSPKAIALLESAAETYSGAASSKVSQVNDDKQTEAIHPSMELEPQMPLTEGRKPGALENEKFECDDSVIFWRNFQINGFESAQENLQNMARITNTFMKNPDSADYWIRHAGRSAYFVANALLGNFGFRLHEQLLNGKETGSPYDGILKDPSIVTKMFLETALSYKQDYKRIQEGRYKKPYDMYQNTRQSSPLYMGEQTRRFVQEAIGTLGRRKRGTEDDKRIRISDGANPSLYPSYYRTAFHYQTDGWLSDRSARVYETSTETLFLGRQDAMQRTALPPLVSHSKDCQGRSMKVLEVACGTGRFMTFARDNLPLDTEYTAIDLSPFYLQATIDNDKNWRRVRSRTEQSQSSKAVDLKPCRAVQAKAEDLPFQDGEFDAVVCVFLFHEIPREMRTQAAAEMARVVRPGGNVVFTDSTQLGDRPVFDDIMHRFEKMNEPFFIDYINDDLPAHFERVGLECRTKTVCASTKTLSFQKPAP